MANWGANNGPECPKPEDPQIVSSTDQPTTRATVRVLLFGRLREDQGWRERLVELPRTVTTVARLQQALDIHCPGLRWAVNQDFVTPDRPLQPGDELAFLPPITGG